MMAKSRRTRWLITGFAAVALVGLAMIGMHPAAPPAARVVDPAASHVPVYHLETDHPTYQSLDELRSGAETILTGTVLSHTVDPGTSPGTDGTGDPLPAVPQTNYAVQVIDTIKGTPAAGDTITVSLTGGTVPEGQFILDGGPAMADGATLMFFLGDAADGKYFPLAGGAAVASQQDDGSFLLPTDATGTQTPMALTVEDVSGDPTPSPTVTASASPTASTSPPAQPRAQKAKVKVPRKIKYKGKTVLLKKTVTTNAGQKAKTKVTVKPKKKKYSRVKITSKGKATIRTFGKKKLKVTLKLTAAATSQYTSYSYTKKWNVKKK